MSTGQGSTRVELRLRLLSALAAIPILALAVWLGGYLLAALAALFAALGLYEAMRLLERSGWSPLRWLGIVWGVAMVSVATIAGYWVVWLLVVGASTLVLAALIMRRSLLAVGDTFFTLLPVVYVALPLAAAMLLREGAAGLQWVVLAFGGTFATDTGAYFVGRRFGRHKMAPSISPGKTWEGAVGGFGAAIAATFALAVLLPDISISWLEALVLGMAIGVVAQAGDLIESKAKRIAGVKDSGTFMPGHGGILDRLDSLLAVFPLVYVASRLV